MSQDKLAKVLKTLGGLEGRKAGELWGKGGTKRVKLDGLCTEAARRLLDLRYDDLDELWEFRVSGKERVWGARIGMTVDIIWWDPRHEVCPSSKKHT